MPLLVSSHLLCSRAFDLVHKMLDNKAPCLLLGPMSGIPCVYTPTLLRWLCLCNSSIHVQVDTSASCILKMCSYSSPTSPSAMHFPYFCPSFCRPTTKALCHNKCWLQRISLNPCTLIPCKESQLAFFAEVITLSALSNRLIYHRDQKLGTENREYIEMKTIFTQSIRQNKTLLH